MFSSELQSAVRTIDTADGSKTLVSASTFNRVARAVRNMSIDGGTIGMNPAGGIHLQLIPAVSSGGGGGTYSGPFAMSATGVAAGRCLLFGDGGNQFVDFPATAYADMYNRYSATSGIVWADIYINNGTWTYFYFILPDNQDPGFYDDDFFWPIGTVDLTAGTFEQWHTGDQIITLPGQGGGGGGGSYSGPFALSWNNGSVDVDYGCIIAGTELINTNRNNFYDTNPYWIILTLTRNSAGTGYTYAYSRTASGGYPAQTATEYKVTIGYVNPSSQTLVQWQHGPIYVAGRVV